ncbi:hypothetical protein SHELI_v1c06610 [Spiroplasma helicoides]|uniref:Uncharacterized protein n=1 Tax=Spiroplasma helicoides TaxID=216938 RepID=A0A1B3SKZ9_9MOLU|nr:hypothetical protein [Spiroplasma helicoides]AOG60612.1 hypothetical protein SHELI_v1c06610 [Spiroplasma helicoides]
MKKFADFIIRIKPYRRLYKMFWLSFAFFSLVLFQILMLIICLFVPYNKHTGFNYWWKGIMNMLDLSWTEEEPKSLVGFVFAVVILGTIPSIPILVVLYFTFANWLIEEKLSDKFINVEKEKYLKWARYFHFLIIGVLFTLIPGSLSYLNGGGLLPHKTFMALKGLGDDSLTNRIAANCSIVYYTIGLLFLLITFFWTIGLFFQWIWSKIMIVVDKYRSYLDIKKQEKRARKLEKVSQKNSKKNNN